MNRREFLRSCGYGLAAAAAAAAVPSSAAPPKGNRPNIH